MKITDALYPGNKTLEGKDKASGAKGASDSSQTHSGAAAAEAAQRDRVDISGRSRDIALATETLATTPDIREAKVAEIKEAIGNNHYKVDAEKVAHKMIVDFLEEIV